MERSTWLIIGLGVAGALATGAALLAKPRRRYIVLGGSAKDAACLDVGQGNEDLGVDPVTFCPTTTQKKWMSAGEKIGCGTFACAYERPDGRVVKVTQDPADIYNLEVGQAHPRVVKMFEAKKIVDKALYAAVLEKLEKPSRKFAYIISRMPLSMLRRNWDAHGGTRTRITKRDYEVPAAVEEAFAERACSRYGETKTRDECETFAGQLVDLHAFYGKKGIGLLDLHEGNFGVNAEGSWRVLDVGFAKTPPPDVEELARVGQ